MPVATSSFLLPVAMASNLVATRKTFRSGILYAFKRPLVVSEQNLSPGAPEMENSRQQCSAASGGVHSPGKGRARDSHW